MANQDRSRFEILRRRSYPTTGTGVITQGDILMNDGSGNATRGITNADTVADAFIGIAIHAKPATSTPDVVVGVDCVAEMQCSGLASAGAIGDAVEFSLHNSDAQTVVIGSTDPIGKLAKPAAVGATTLTVHFVGRSVFALGAAD